jgi:hypothetical protein
MYARIPAIVLLILAIAGRAVPVGAQSLANAARQEEERRKAVKDGGKVYTNKDLKDVPPAPAAPADDASKDDKASSPTEKTEAGKAADTTKATDQAKADSKDKVVQKDQAYWGGRAKALQEALDRDTLHADALQTRINALTTDFVNRDDPAQRAVIASDRDKAIAELARLKKQIVDDTQAIADLQEEARRANVPPGWLR